MKKPSIQKTTKLRFKIQKERKSLDRHGERLHRGDPVKIHSQRGALFGLVSKNRSRGEMVLVRVGSDPFDSYISFALLEKLSKIPPQLRNMSLEDTSQKVGGKMAKAKELREKARNLSIEGWENMDRDELEAAIAEAEAEDEQAEEAAMATEEATKPRKGKKGKKARKAEAPKASKKGSKAKSSKKTAKVSADGVNPYREGSNLYWYTEALMKGGTRTKMINWLKGKVNLKPRTKRKDYDPEAAIDRKLVVVAKLLEDEHGFRVKREGRGVESTVKASPPK